MRVLRKSHKEGSPLEFADVGNGLQALQTEVGGYIQVVSLHDVADGIMLICNEDGHMLGLPYNFSLPWGDHVVGTVLFVREDGEDGEEFSPVLDADSDKLCNVFGFTKREEQDEDK